MTIKIRVISAVTLVAGGILTVISASSEYPLVSITLCTSSARKKRVQEELDFPGFKNREVKHTVDDLAFAIRTRKAALQDFSGLFGQPGLFWFLEKKIEVPHDGLEGRPELVGDGHHDTLATFIIALDPVLKPLIFRSIDHVDKESQFPGSAGWAW